MIDKAIQEFVKDRVGGVIVNDDNGNILYKDKRIILSDKAKESWVRKRPAMDDRKCWEFTDLEDGKYYRVETASVNIDGTEYQCHLFTDVSDYATLFQDISDYSKRIADMSDFQKSILAKISMDYDSCLPELTGFCEATDSVLLVEDLGSHIVKKSTYSRRLHRTEVPLNQEMEELFNLQRFGFSDGYYCLLSEKTDIERYVLLLRRGQNFNEEYFRDASVYNVIRLYIENGILREKIIYENEHDKLTDLYNKGKYMSLRESDFGSPKCLAIFNFDVNNLKKVNDTKGHEAGDQLIISAADSIHGITDDKIMGFRMGGDEFLVIAPDITREEADKKYEEWLDIVDRINSEQTDEDIVIACGRAYGEGKYDLDLLLQSADEDMYLNKKKLKEGAR